MSTETSKLYTAPGFSPWVFNGRIDQSSFIKRWGYTVNRNLGTNAPVYVIARYVTTAGTPYTIYLTDKDACKKETATGKTFSYITDTGDYNGSVTSIATNVVTFKAATIADTEDIAIGDMFILDTDHTADVEPDTNWAEIATVVSAGGFITGLTLTASYTGTTGSWGGAEKPCLVRRVYSAADASRWTYSIVGGKFCFTNGNTNVQYWAGSGYCTALDATNATKAKYCIEYASRLVLGNLYVSAALAPFTIKGSDLNTPTAWTGTSSFEIDLLDTEDHITGLATAGPNLFVFKPDSYSIWYRTGLTTDPIKRGSTKLGHGSPAPYSLVQVKGTAAWMGRDDFYVLNGEDAEAIGQRIRHFFFSEADPTTVWAGVNYLTYEIMWVADTLNYGKMAFVWNWKYSEWYLYRFPDDITCLGRGVYT